MTLTREHARMLELAMQMFGRLWGTMLSSRLGALTAVKLENLELITYDDYTQSLPQTSPTFIMAVEPSRSAVLLQMPTDTTMMLVDCLLGGPAKPLLMPFRELTDIEWGLVKDMLDAATKDFAYGFASIMPMQLEVRNVKYNPQFMQIAPATEPVLVARFTMSIGGNDSPISLMLVAEPILAALREADAPEGRTDEEQRLHMEAVNLMLERAQEIPLTIAVRFRGRTMGAREITRLEVGSVIPLFHSADQPLDVAVDDVVLAHAAIGVNGTRLACLVVSSEEDS